MRSLRHTEIQLFIDGTCGNSQARLADLQCQSPSRRVGSCSTLRAARVLGEASLGVCVDKPLASSINGLAQHTKLEISPDVFVHYEGRFRCCWRELFKITRSSQSKRLMNIDDWLIRFDRDAKG